MTAINLGRVSPPRLGATYPPTLRNHINVGLLGIAARRDCPFHPKRAPPASGGYGLCGLRLKPSGLRQPCPLARATDRTPSVACMCLLRLVSVALILTSRWAAVSCYAVLCSPDVPPVPGFPYGTSGGLACFTARLSPTGGRSLDWPWRCGVWVGISGRAIRPMCNDAHSMARRLYR